MVALIRLLLLPVRIPLRLLRLLRAFSVFVACGVPLLVAAAIAGGILWYAFVR